MENLFTAPAKERLLNKNKLMHDRITAKFEYVPG
jgi:hypothetical protein